jgi:glycosyltransferase involved in cell wall biosynthesis
MIHPAMQTWLERAVAPSSISAIRNPVQPFGPMVAAPEWATRLAYVGQVQRLKGVFDIAEAGRRLGLSIDFFGEGDAREELMRRYPEHDYHGWTPRGAIGAELATVRACIVATQSPEPFCMSAFEAVATGLPLVLSDSILAADELAASGAALTYPAANVGALTSLLRRISTDDTLIARLGRAARAATPVLAQPLDAWVDAHRALYAQRLALSRAVAAGAASRIAAQ